MTLHLVFSRRGWHACRARLSEGDAIVLLGDGVYAADQVDASGVAVLEQDLKIRGVKTAATHKLIDYPGMVELCTQHNPVVSWRD